MSDVVKKIKAKTAFRCSVTIDSQEKENNISKSKPHWIGENHKLLI